MNKIKGVLTATAVSLLLLAGCSGANGSEATAMIAADVEIKQTAVTADPQGAVEAVFEQMNREMPEPVETLDILGIEEADVQQSCVYMIDAKDGLVTIAILLPAESERDTVREGLHLYRDAKVDEYRNYDILDSSSIAQESQVFDQGDYIILLMLPDIEQAKETIDLFMPQ